MTINIDLGALHLPHRRLEFNAFHLQGHASPSILHLPTSILVKHDVFRPRLHLQATLLPQRGTARSDHDEVPLHAMGLPHSGEVGARGGTYSSVALCLRLLGSVNNYLLIPLFPTSTISIIHLWMNSIMQKDCYVWFTQNNLWKTENFHL